jgi:hypothetical protein
VGQAGEVVFAQQTKQPALSHPGTGGNGGGGTATGSNNGAGGGRDNGTAGGRGLANSGLPATVPLAGLGLVLASLALLAWRRRVARHRA